MALALILLMPSAPREPGCTAAPGKGGRGRRKAAARSSPVRCDGAAPARRVLTPRPALPCPPRPARVLPRRVVREARGSSEVLPVLCQARCGSAVAQPRLEREKTPADVLPKRAPTPSVAAL